MRNKVLIIIVCFLTLMLSIYFLYDHTMPKAVVIDYPKYNLIDSITLRESDGTIIKVNEDDYEVLYRYICESIPTRKRSVNEVPYIEHFYTVEIKSQEISIYGYGHIYDENGNAYLEIPYVGIYRINNDVLEMLIN